GASVTGGVATDTRWNPPVAGGAALPAHDAASVSQGAAAAFGNDVFTAQDTLTTANLIGELRFPIVTLGPGTGLVVRNSVVNEAITVAMFGYSRQARPEELTL